MQLHFYEDLWYIASNEIFKNLTGLLPIAKIERHIHKSLYFLMFDCLRKSKICRDMMEAICGISTSALHFCKSAEEAPEIVLKEF